MDLNVALHPGLSVAAHIVRERERDANMLNNNGWRLVHSKQPKKQSKKQPKNDAKAITPLRIVSDGPTTTDDSGDRRRQPSWLKTRSVSRPDTPVSAVATTVEDTEDTRSERSETSAPRRDSKPKLARYTSLFTNLKDTPKDIEFTEPWSEDAPPFFQPYIDPLDVLQAVRSHMLNSSQPIPVDHNSGLFRVFEDYRKSREHKERLESLLKDTLLDWETAEKHWSAAESRYDAEIRRLELFIACGTSGMTGLMMARQGSVIDRRGRHRKTVSHDSFPPTYDLLSNEQLDTQIKRRSQQVILHRPVSPSGKMKALSKQLGDAVTELPVGTPPTKTPEEGKKITLSRKVQSELNLAALKKTRAPPSITSSVASAFSGISGDPLPDETATPNQAPMELAAECDALIALRELGTLVARRRGLNADSFNEGLMMLFANTSAADTFSGRIEEEDAQLFVSETNHMNRRSHLGQTQKPDRALRKFQSQPQLNMQHKHRRQFSFEPGADQLQALVEEFRSFDSEEHDSDSDDSTSPLVLHARRSALDSQSMMSSSSSLTLSTDFSKPSKIPSPVQTLGRVRRENSGSSLQSLYVRPHDSRHNSRTSVLTAFRQNSSGNLRPAPQSRSSSIHDLRATDSSLSSKDQQGRLRSNVMALATARGVADTGSQTSLSEGGSLPKSVSRPPTPQATNMQGAVKLENNDLKERHQNAM